MDEARDDARVTQGDALIDCGPLTVKMLGDIFEANARSTQWAMDQTINGLTAENVRLQDELDAALDRIWIMRRRLAWMFGDEVGEA